MPPFEPYPTEAVTSVCPSISKSAAVGRFARVMRLSHTGPSREPQIAGAVKDLKAAGYQTASVAVLLGHIAGCPNTPDTDRQHVLGLWKQTVAALKGTDRAKAIAMGTKSNVRDFVHAAYEAVTGAPEAKVAKSALTQASRLEAA